MEANYIYIFIFLIAMAKFFIQKEAKKIPEAMVVSFISVCIILFIWYLMVFLGILQKPFFTSPFYEML